MRVEHEEWVGRYAGTISEMSSDSCTVIFDDGDVKEALPFNTVFATEKFSKGDKVSVLMDDWYEPYEGEILSVAEQGDEETTYKIHFAADGTTEDAVVEHQVLTKVS